MMGQRHEVTKAGAGAVQGTEELEEVLSQRLQELPPPGESSHGGSRDSPCGDMPFLVDFEQRRRVRKLPVNDLLGGEGGWGTQG